VWETIPPQLVLITHNIGLGHTIFLRESFTLIFSKGGQQPLNKFGRGGAAVRP